MTSVVYAVNSSVIGRNEKVAVRVILWQVLAAERKKFLTVLSTYRYEAISPPRTVVTFAVIRLDELNIY